MGGREKDGGTEKESNPIPVVCTNKLHDSRNCRFFLHYGHEAGTALPVPCIHMG